MVGTNFVANYATVVFLQCPFLGFGWGYLVCNDLYKMGKLANCCTT